MARGDAELGRLSARPVSRSLAPLRRLLPFLVPYRGLLLHGLWKPVLFSLAITFFNLTAFFFYAARICFLKDTGRKLAHFDRDLNSGRTPMPSHLHREELN